MALCKFYIEKTAITEEPGKTAIAFKLCVVALQGGKRG
jgi:hypothetical protein